MLAWMASLVLTPLGPRFEKEDAAALSAGTVPDGRVWKYLGSGVVTGLPLASSLGLPVLGLITGSANDCPMILEATSLPPTWTCWPLALPGKATWLTPVMNSGYRIPNRRVRARI